MLVLLALTIVLTALALNTRNLRSSFANYITQQVQRNVTIGGDVEIDLGFSESGSLLMTLKTQDVVIYNNPDFSAEPMLHVPWIELEIGLLSILTGGFDVQRLLIERPRFDLARLTDGRSNWQDIGILAVVPAKQVNVYAGVVHWHDRMTQQAVMLADLSWRSSRSETDSTVSWQTSFQFLSEVLRLPLAVRLTANVPPKPGQSSGVVLNEVVGSVTAPGLVLSMKLPEMSVDIDSGRIHVEESAVDIAAAGTEAALKITDLNIDTSTRQIEVALLDADCFVGRSTPSITAEAMAIDLSRQRIVVPEVVVTWLDTELFGDLSATWAGGEPDVLANFDIPSANVQAILDNAGIVLTSFASNGLRPVSLNGKLRMRENLLVLDDLNLKTGNTIVTGWVRRDREDSATWTFALESDDFLLADTAEDGSRSITSAGVLVGLLGDRLSDLPTDVAATGSIVVDRLWIDRILAKHVIAKIRSKKPLILIRQAVSDFNLGKLLRDAGDIAGIEASADLELILAVQGRTGAELLKNARGIARGDLRNGELSAELFNRVLGDVDTQLAKAISAQLPELRIEQASTTVRIDRGIVQNQDFRFAGQEFWMEGKGSMSLSAGGMDYKILLALENDLSRDLGNVPVIPFQITGSVGDPKITLDVQELVRYKIEHELTGVLPRPSSVLPDQAAIMLVRQIERQITHLQKALDSE